MTRAVPLQCHPATPAPWARAVHAEARWGPDGGVRLRYRLQGDLRALCLPGAEPRRHTDGLWRRTCCEAFLLGVDAPGYREVNLSPAGAWAGYAFGSYRQPEPVAELPDPAIWCSRREGEIVLEALVAAAWLPPGPRLRLGLTAVLEASGGALSYWALGHPGAQPDFHHPEGFLMALDR